MSIPAVQKLRISAYILRQIMRGRRRFPLVLMLEPLFRCNLRCRGCGKIAASAETLGRFLSVSECVAAAAECGAPVVSIAGGEPLLHPDIHLIVRKLTAAKRFVYLCTNALLLPQRIAEFSPSRYLTFSIHLDGLREQHDLQVGRRGVFDRALSAIHLLLSKGFRVTTNTTFFKDQTPGQAARFFHLLTSLGVEGMTVSPAFGYETAPERRYFPDRSETRALFRGIFEVAGGRQWHFNHSRLYLDFLAGGREYGCTPWGNPTRNIYGWQRPCYLLDDGYAASFAELMAETDWSVYGFGKDLRCSACMVHSGFEASAVLDTLKNPLNLFRPYPTLSPGEGWVRPKKVL